MFNYSLRVKECYKLQRNKEEKKKVSNILFNICWLSRKWKFLKMKVKVVNSVSHFLRNLLGNNFTICILMMCICLSLQYNMNMFKWENWQLLNKGISVPPAVNITEVIILNAGENVQTCTCRPTQEKTYPGEKAIKS